MARPKGSKNKANTKAVSQVKQPKIDPRIEEMYQTEVEFICPVRGKVKQKVWVKKIRSPMDQSRHYIPSSDSLDDIEKKDDGLGIYGEEPEGEQ